MFSTLYLNNLESIETTNEAVCQAPSKTKRIEVKNIVLGASHRSRNGCKQCRRRK